MTVPNLESFIIHQGNGATTFFDTTDFELNSSDEVDVFLSDNVTEVITLVSPEDYNIPAFSTPQLAVIQYPLSGPPLAAGKSIIIARNTNLLQLVKITNQTGYNANVVMGVWDKLYRIMQEQSRDISRSAKLPFGNVGIELPSPIPRKTLVGNSTGTGWINGPSQSEPAPDVLRKRYVSLSDYAPSSDAADCFSATQAFLNAMEGREGVIDNPIGGLRTYRHLTRSDGTSFLPNTGRLINETGAKLNWAGWGTASATRGDVMLQRVGAGISRRNSTTNLIKTSRSFTVDSGTGGEFYPGQILFLQNDDLFTLDENNGTEELGLKGEWSEVAYVVGDVVHLIYAVQDTYVDTVRVFKMDNMPDLIIENIQIEGPGQFDGDVGGDRGLLIGNAKSISILGGSITGCDFQGVLVASAKKGLIDNLTVRQLDGGKNKQVSYGIAVANATGDFTIRDCEVAGGREGICPTTTGDGFGLRGVTRGLKIINNVLRGFRRTGIPTHDNHEDMLISGNRIIDCEQGIDIRIGDVTITNNSIKRTGGHSGTLDCGIQLASGVNNLRIHNNYYEDVLRGHWMSDNIDHEKVPGDISIHNDVIRGSRCVVGTLLDFDGSARVADTAPLGKVNITNIDYHLADGAGVRGVQLNGKWDNPTVTGKMTGGVGGRSVFMTSATGAEVGGNGPRNPHVDITIGESIREPLIQYETGLTKVKATGIGFNTASEI